MISEYFGAAGPEWLGPHNKHGALIAHVLVGGAYGNFEQDLGPYKAQDVAFYTINWLWRRSWEATST